MERNLDHIVGRAHDLVVIGGGIFGACAAWDATLRGLSVVLIERDDFGGATSANSFRMAHGGIRYLQHADIVRVRQSCRERSALLRVAPHLVEPLPIAIPTYGHGREGKAFLGAGLLAYDLLTLDRNRGIPDPTRHVPWGRLLGRRALLDLFPSLEDPRLTGAAVFCDGQFYSGPRLVLSFLRAAVERGALAANYLEATGLLQDSNGRVTGVSARDRVSGEDIEVRAAAVLNATGPWAPDFLRRSLPGTAAPRVPFSRDACFIVSKRFPGRLGLAMSGATKDPDALLSRAARHLFVVPWRDYSLVGVWHVVWPDHPDTVTVTEPELGAFLHEVNGAFPGLDLALEDVRAWNAGLVPFGDNDPEAKNLRYGHRSHVIDHGQDGLPGLVSLIGVRYTVARGDAAHAVDLAVAAQGRQAPRPPTEREPVFGGDFARFDDLVAEAGRASPVPLDEPTLTALAHNYGAEYGRVLAYAREAPDPGENRGESLGETLDGSRVLKAEVVHAVREEMALNLTDVAFRRTDLATGGDPGEAALGACAALMARERGWSEAETERQLEAVRARLFRNGPGRAPAATDAGPAPQAAHRQRELAP